MRLRRRRGANAVEFALIAGPLFLIIMGTMEYSWFLFHQTMLDSAVREGARVASRTIEDPYDAGQTAAEEFWANNGMKGTLSFAWSSQNAGPSAVVLVVLEGEVPYGRLLNGLVPIATSVKATAAVRDEVNNAPPS